MTHSNLKNPELNDALISSRIEEIRREIEIPPIVVAKSKKISLLRGLVIPVAIILIWLGITQYRFINPQAGTSVFVLSEVEILGPSDLCPGGSLRFRVNVDVAEAGVYSLAMSTWRISPLPATYVFSEGLDMVIAESREFPIEIEWSVPQTYLSLATSKREVWPEGLYSRDIAVTAIGRNTRPSTLKVPFTIKPGCEG